MFERLGQMAQKPSTVQTMGNVQVQIEAQVVVVPDPSESSRFVRLPRDVSAFVRANRLTDVDGWRSTRHFLSLMVVYAVACVIALRTDSLLVAVPVLLAQAFVLLSFSAAWHEGVHGLLYRSARGSHVSNA
jgi:hypothetical protein